MCTFKTGPNCGFRFNRCETPGTRIFARCEYSFPAHGNGNELSFSIVNIKKCRIIPLPFNWIIKSCPLIKGIWVDFLVNTTQNLKFSGAFGFPKQQGFVVSLLKNWSLQYSYYDSSATVQSVLFQKCFVSRPLLSPSFHTNLWLLRRHSWFAERKIRYNNSTFEGSSLLWMVSLLFLLRIIPRFNALIPLNTGCPVSSQRLSPFLKQWSPTFNLVCNHNHETTFLRFQVLWMPTVLSQILMHIVAKVQASSYPLLWMSMSLNMDMKRIRSSVFPVRSGNSPKRTWILWRISTAENPAKIFHSNSIGFPSIPNSSLKELFSARKVATWPLHCSVASPVVWIFLNQSAQNFCIRQLHCSIME